MKPIMKRLIPLLLVLALMVSLCWYVLVYDRDTVKDFLMAQARSFAKSGHFDTAAWLYDLSYEFADNNANVAIDLAELYRASGNYTKAEYTLVHAISDGPTAELYMALCDVFVEQDKLLDAANLLDQISNKKVKARMDELRPAAPVADFEPGFYSQYLEVAFPKAEGTLYVSTDGEYPSTSDDPYTGPIQLEGGETKLYAIAVGENGLVSPLSTLTYTIGGVVEEVEFADALLEDIIREQLMYGSDTTIYTDALWTITELTVPEDTKDLSDLQHLTYLEKLTITDRRIKDLSFLENMLHLEELNLSGCELEGDYSIIGTLPALEKLDMSRCAISSLTFLKGAPALKELNLSSNAIGNLTLLGSISTLEVLDLHDNAVAKLEPLSQLTGLRELDLAENLLSSITPLESCTALTSLNVSDNKLKAIASVSKMSKLVTFRASKNQIADTGPLASCLNLETLDLSSNQIGDISMLSALTRLADFNFSHNAVTALPNWPASAALVTIDGSYNLISSLSQLDRLEALNYVYMDYNAEIEKIAFLADNPNLVQINVYGTKVNEAQATRCMDHSIIVHYNPIETP